MYFVSFGISLVGTLSRVVEPCGRLPTAALEIYLLTSKLSDELLSTRRASSEENEWHKKVAFNVHLCEKYRHAK